MDLDEIICEKIKQLQRTWRLYQGMQSKINVLFVCHGSILKCSRKACEINGFMVERGAYHTILEMTNIDTV